MPKSKKSKAKHKDFNKVKLKVGRKLPRADNETNTAFRSRDILLREQFHASDGSEPTTRRKLNVKELLSQCQHFSASVRRDAVSGLNELMTSHPEVIASNLSGLLDRVSELFADKDGEVRSNVTKLLRVLYPGVSQQNMTPFFSLVSAHLCCAMTHIYDDIKADSLTILDLCLEHYPTLVTADSSRILENFLEQISSKSQSTKKQRTLLVNPNNKLTSQKWRLRVLQRIHTFLKALILSKINASSNYESSLFGSCALLHQLPHYLYQPMAAQSVSSEDPISGYIPMLVPLLLECWVEAGPSQMTSNLPGNALSEESMSLLYCVVSILSFLLEYVVESRSLGTLSLADFRQQFSKDIVQHLFAGFPYCMHEKPRNLKAKQKTKKASTTVSVMTMNISVCRVMSFLWVDSRKQAPKTQMTSVITFLSAAIDDQEVNAEQMTSIVSVLDQLISRKISGAVVEPLLTAIMSVFKSRHPSSKEVMAVHSLFTKYALDEFDCISLKGNELVNSWMSSLPGHFLAIKDDDKRSNDILRIRSSCLRTMLRASAQNPKEFSPSLHAKLDAMLDAEFFHALPVPLKEGVLQLTWGLPTITRNRFKILAVLHQKKCIPAHLLNSLVQRLAHRYVKEKSEGTNLQFECEDFISFVLSLCIGSSVEDLQSLKPKAPVLCSPAIELNPLNLVDAASIVEACCSALRNIGSELQLSEIAFKFFSEFMVKYPIVPLSSACCVLLMSKQWLPVHPRLVPMHKNWIAGLLVAVATSLTPEVESRSVVLKLCLQTLSTSDELMAKFLELSLGFVEGSSEADAVEQILRILNELMEISQLDNPQIFNLKSSALLSAISLAAQETSSEKVLISFRYSASLLQ